MMAPTLEKFYKEEIVPQMMEEFKYKSVMQVPTIQKICLNQGVGDATQDKKLVDVYQKEMTTIAGQMAVTVETLKSVSNFKLREGMEIGAKIRLLHTTKCILNCCGIF